MHFNGLFEKSPTKSRFKWSVLIMDKGECKHSTGKTLGTLLFLNFINDLQNGLIQNLLLTTLLYFLPYKISSQALLD